MQGTNFKLPYIDMTYRLLGPIVILLTQTCIITVL